MTISLSGGNDYYYSDEYKTIIRSCKEVLLQNAQWSEFVDNSIRFAYRYNFHKFLRNLRTQKSDETAIPEELIWTISFINGIEDPTQDFSYMKGIWTVNIETVDMLIQATRTRRE